jgi:hypothetical protein
MQKLIDDKLANISLFGYALTLSTISIVVILVLTNLNSLLL